MNVQKDIDRIASELSVSNEKMENLKPIIADIYTVNQDIHMLTEDLVSCTETELPSVLLLAGRPVFWRFVLLVLFFRDLSCFVVFFKKIKILTYFFIFY